MNLKKIKMSFLLMLFLLIAMLCGGVSLLRGNYYLKNKYLLMQLRFLALEGQIMENNPGEMGKIFLSYSQAAGVPLNNKNAQIVPVLLYHGVMSDPNWKPDGVNISLSDFEDQMLALKAAGYQSVSLSDFNDFMKGERVLPEKSVLITFDDGRSDSYYNADPVLRAAGFRAVMFTITGRSLGPDNAKETFHLNEDELQKMLESGRWEIESHTQNGHGNIKTDAAGDQGYFLTNKMWLDSENRLETDTEFETRIDNDLAGSKEDLENKLGVKVLGFAYPFGDFGQENSNYLQGKDILTKEVDSLFPLSFRQSENSEYPGDYPGNGYHLIKRLDIQSPTDINKFISLVGSTREKSIPYSDNFLRDQGWLDAWGSSKLSQGLLLTGATQDEDSSLTFLNGTALWKDYKMNAILRLMKGSSFAIVVRYNNENNYASCDFSDSHISLTQRIAGQESVVSESDNNFPINSQEDMNVSIEVRGGSAACFLNGNEITSGDISSNLNHGGIGFKTWNNKVFNSSLLVKKIDVE